MTAAAETEAAGEEPPGRFGRPVVRGFLAAHPLAGYAIRRFGLYLLELWGSLTIAFFFFRMIPGDPIQTFIQTLQQNYVYNQQASAEVIARYQKEFGLDGNIFAQYWHYMRKLIFEQDLGPSLINYPTPATEVIMQLAALDDRAAGHLRGAGLGDRARSPARSPAGAGASSAPRRRPTASIMPSARPVLLPRPDPGLRLRLHR